MPGFCVHDLLLKGDIKKFMIREFLIIMFIKRAYFRSIMDNRDKEFPGGKDLTHCLEWYGWALYDVTPPTTRIEPFSWEEISKRDQATSCLVSHNYYLYLYQKRKKLLN